ncbi:hypothetical protein Bca101_101502 [Brassica carinata]
MRDEPKPGYGAQLRANLEPTKGVGRLRQQDGGHGSRNPLRRREPGGAAAGADLGGSSKYSNENFEGRRGERFHVNGTCTWPAHPETAQPEVGSSGWKSTARRVVSVHSRALENPEDRKPPRPVALITASGLQGEQPLCSECQSEEIQPSALNHSQGNGLGRISGKEDPVELDSNELNENRNLVEQKGKSSLDSDFQYEYEPQAAHSDAAFDPSMSALPIIVKQNSPSVGLFTHQ